MSTISTTDTVSPKLMLQAAEWRLLALLLERPLEGWAKQVASLAKEIHDEQLIAAATAAQEQASRSLYDTTFGPGGPAAPREISYRQGLDAGAFLAELTAFYQAFAYQRGDDEPPDHAAVEAGFVGYLKLKELYARVRGNEEEATVVAEAVDRFIQDHLAMLAEPLAASLDRSGIGYLSLAASSLLRRVGPRRVFDWAGADALPVLSGDEPTCGCAEL
jgi:hypothetical protein